MFSCLGLPSGSVGKQSVCSVGNPCSIPGSGKSAREGIGYPLQYFWASLVAQLIKISFSYLLQTHFTQVLGLKEIQPVLSKGDQPWVFFGRNDAKAETPVLWPPHVKS